MIQFTEQTQTRVVSRLDETVFTADELKEYGPEQHDTLEKALTAYEDFVMMQLIRLGKKSGEGYKIKQATEILKNIVNAAKPTIQGLWNA